MATTVRCVDFQIDVAAGVLQLLNPSVEITIEHNYLCGKYGTAIICETCPANLTYPEGWYYCDGEFTNKGNTSTGVTSKAIMLQQYGSPWKNAYRGSTAR